MAIAPPADLTAVLSKLSKLQKLILLMAASADWQRRAALLRVPAGLYPAEILHAYYGWPLAWRDQPDAAFHRMKPSGRRFRPAEIGEKQYAAGMAAVSRAIRRLKDRGLVELVGKPGARGVNITPAGATLSAWLPARNGNS